MTDNQRNAFDPTDERLANIEWVDAKEQEYFMEAKLGHDVFEWLCSDVGRYLKGRAKIETDMAKEGLSMLDFDDPAAIPRAKALQLKIEVGRSFTRWVAEALNNGQAAEAQLETYRSD